nr:tRNA (adenosine(37)-N6)-threonylcarbamoyltransferase complex transferase subunit TsaD [Desulfobulbaceae bacterium]
MLILGVESSCDETAAAVIADNTTLLSSVINSQIEIHSLYGGVVPELASRHHVENIYPVVNEALVQAGISISDLDGLAVTQGPGLIGSLLVGLSFVKAISYVTKIPYVGVDHLSGHLLSVFLGDSHPEFPYIALVASGGHSSIFKVDSWSSFTLLGRSRDDAAGEAFDKVAKLLGLPYPGGPVISEISKSGDPCSIKFPRAWLDKDSLDFSFSGVKTSVANHVNQCQQKNTKPALEDICASFQEAVCDVLVDKTIRAAQLNKIASVVVAGGVAANPRLRELFSQRCKDTELNLFLTPTSFCSDNAAMIALAGSFQFEANKTLTYDMDVYSRSQIAP